MAKSRYLPSSDPAKVAWLANFATKLPTYQALFGLTAAEVAQVTADNVLVQYIWAYVNGSRTRAADLNAFRKALFDGPAFPALPAVPAPAPFAMAGAAPALTPPDVFGRIGTLATRLKAHPSYTLAIGEDLGVEGTEQIFDPEGLKPGLSTRMVAGGVCEIIWSKGKAGALEIEVDRGQGWVFLAIDTVPNYQDTHPVPAGQSALWKYRAIYRIGDERVGQWSDVIQVAVAG